MRNAWMYGCGVHVPKASCDRLITVQYKGNNLQFVQARVQEEVEKQVCQAVEYMVLYWKDFLLNKLSLYGDAFN